MHRTVGARFTVALGTVFHRTTSEVVAFNRTSEALTAGNADSTRSPCKGHVSPTLYSGFKRIPVFISSIFVGLFSLYHRNGILAVVSSLFKHHAVAFQFGGAFSPKKIRSCLILPKIPLAIIATLFHLPGSKRVSASIVLGVGSRISTSLLWVLISNCSHFNQDR